MPKTVDRAPTIGIVAAIDSRCISEKFHLVPSGAERECLLLEIDLRAMVMRIGKGADEQ